MFVVVVMPRARREVKATVAWWRANRPSNPRLLELEFEELVTSLAFFPNRGVASRAGRRRLVLPKTNYTVVYRVHPRAMRVEVLAIKHGARER